MVARPIPYASEQGIFSAYQGIEAGKQGTWRAIRDLAPSVDDVRKFRFINVVFDQINPDIRLSWPNITHIVTIYSCTHQM